MNTLVNDPDVPVTVANVSFEPGVRNNWHKHNGGFQIILATAGEGWYQEEGQPPVKLHAGDVALAKDGVKHWHGATADSWFSHLVITAGMAEWLEPVGDDEYTEIHEYR
jgi:double-stranded beta-helix related protein